MIPDGVFGLELGALDLMGHLGDKSGPFWFEALTDETEFGEPVPAVKAVESFLMDGAIETTESFDNREMTLRVAVRGEDSAGLAAGEQALTGELYKPNTMTYRPPNKIVGYGTPTVFRIVNSSMSYAFDDVAERNLERVYKITLKALPMSFARDQVTVTVPAPPNTSVVTTLVDACNSTTGWTGTPNTPTTSGGAVIETASKSGAGSLVVSLARSGLSASMTTTPYVRLDLSKSGTGLTTPITAPTVKINGTTVAATATSGSVGWYLCPSSTLTSVSASTSTYFNNPGSLTLLIADISRSDQPRDQTGQKQTFRSINVAGAARTPGSLALEDPTAALGSALIYTTPNGGSVAQPPLRVLRTAGSTEITDSTTVSGKSSDLATLHTFDIPASQVPSAGYLLVARMKHATAGTYTVTYGARTLMGSTTDAGQSGTLPVTVPADGWVVRSLAKLVLPNAITGSAGFVRIELSGPAGLKLDEAWLFNTDDGQLTWVECGTGAGAAGGSSNRLWLDPASLSSPVPSVLVGSAADRSDSRGAGALMQSFSEHRFVPPTMNVFTVTTDSVAAAITVKFWPAYHTHVA